MFRTTLLYPDDVSWTAEEGYSEDARNDLITAYQHIRRQAGLTAGFLHALRAVQRWIGKRTSAHQRLHFYYLSALAHGANEDWRLALYWIDQALSLASRLNEVGDQQELLRLSALYHRSALKFEYATEDLNICLALVDEQRARIGVDDPATRLAILPNLATYEYFLAHFDSAQELLDQARRLAPLAPTPQPLDFATIEWTQAKLYDLKGLPQMALRHILPAAEVYKQLAPAISYERLLIDVAEYYLSWAESLPPGGDRHAFIAQAEAHLTTAEGIALERGDREGAALVRLRAARASRLAGEPISRVRSIEAVIRLGEERGDVGLLAQGHSALGDELSSHGAWSSALKHYHEAAHISLASQVPALALPAQRAIARAGEMGWTDL